MIGFSASESNVTLRAVIDDQINLNLIQSIHGDKRRFLQILLNFLSNSIKFTDKNGSITVSIKVLDHQLKHLPSSEKDIKNILMQDNEV
jgi:signal transduction histidine kinase